MITVILINKLGEWVQFLTGSIVCLLTILLTNAAHMADLEQLLCSSAAKQRGHKH